MKNEGQRVAAPGDRGTIPDRPSWHTLTVEDVLRDLQTAPTGLTSEEATRRLDLYGANALTAAGTVSAWKTLAAQFKNALILILLGATVVSAFLGHTLESAAIAAIVLFAVFLGFIQEYRAEKAMDALRAIAAPTAHVLRDDEETCIAARELVPGDVILLRPGDRIPADARVTQAINLACDESSLTGESIAVEKTADSITEHLAPIAERRNLVFAGTLATSGRGHAVVVATAMNTEFGQISGLVQVVKAGPTPLQQNLDRLGRTLGKAALVVVALIVVAGVARGLPLLDMFIFGVALAVAVVPEALPAVVTISLAIGVRRMVKRNALVRHLPVVETLGSTAVICTDKTGTLTKNEMTVRRIYAGEKLIDVTGAGYEPAGAFLAGGEPVEPPSDILELLRAATLCSDAGLVCADERWQIRGDPTEGALIVAAQKAGIDTDALQAALPRVQEIPFTSERRQMTTLHRAADETVAFSKGASEVIIENCAFERVGGGDVPLDAAARTRLQAIEQTMTAQGLRVLAVACNTAVGLEDAEHEMTFLGYVAMMDPPRPEVAQAVQTCERAGITTVMITGDHPLTAKTIASELGILNDGGVVSGRELAAMTDEQLARDVEQIRVYARVSPADKLRIVAAWQERGHVVAMTGDGINDAPALKKADVGIAMGITGTDVSREAAGMTLLDDNFASIEAAIEEGRIVFGNIKKYLSYLLSSNVGEILLMAGAMLAGLPLPLTAVQILYVNLATDGLPALALAVDPPEADLMKRKPRDAGEGVFTRPIVVLLLAGGIWSALVNLSLFMWLIRSGRPVENAMAMTFVSLVLIQFFKAYNFRSDRASVLERPFANRWLNLAVGWELVLLALIIYTPVLQRPFGTYSVPFADWAILIALSASVVPILELVKWSIRRGWLGVPPKEIDGSKATRSSKVESRFFPQRR